MGLPIYSFRPHFLNPTATFLNFAILITLVSASGTVSLTEYPSYSVQRYCVQQCIWLGLSNGFPALPHALGCASPYSDSCLCRSDLAGSASSFLASCANSACSNTNDVTSAQDLYSAYCASDLPLVSAIPTLSINSAADFSSLRSCGQECLYSGPPDGSGALTYHMGCLRPALNGCFCRADILTSVETFLTICASKWCSGNTGDINSAVSVYAGYCDAATNAAAITATGGQKTTDIQASTAPKSTGSTVPITGGATPTSSASPSSTAAPSGGGLSTGALVGVIVGPTFSVLASVIGIYFKCIQHRKKMEKL